MPPIYVTGHRNPDTDSIASAIGYSELLSRLDPNNEYLPVRLGECNAQTRWVLERGGACEPAFLPHLLLRACDVMQTSFPMTGQDEPIRAAGLAMARAKLDLVPIVDDDGALTGVVTGRALARRYIRETRRVSTLKEAPTQVSAVVDVLEGELVAGEDKQLAGRVWVQCDGARAQAQGPASVRPDGHRRPDEGDRPSDRRRHGDRRTELRDAPRGQRDRASGRDEPKEGSGAEAAGGTVTPGRTPSRGDCRRPGGHG